MRRLAYFSLLAVALLIGALMLPSTTYAGCRFGGGQLYRPVYSYGASPFYTMRPYGYAPYSMYGGGFYGGGYYGGGYYGGYGPYYGASSYFGPVAPYVGGYYRGYPY